jgi:hypothetical protein
MDHFLILKWAAGGEVSLPAHCEYKEEELIDLIRLHNLSGRFLKKIKNHPNYKFSRKLIKLLKQHHRNVEQSVERNIKSFLEIKNTLPHNIKIITIKGFSTYIIVNKKEVMRTGDIDIISNNGLGLIGELKKQHYKLTKKPFLYELGEYTKDGIEVDVHEYFPIYSYTNSLISDILNPKKSLDLWQQNYEMLKINITYDLLSEYLYESCIENNIGIITTGDPNIMIIIICAHAFMNFVNIWSISHRSKTYVRLGELADLFELIEHNRFNRKKFGQLVEKLQAYDSIRWVHYITQILFKKSPFANENIDNKLIEYHLFPRNIWRNFWIAFPIEEELLLKNNWYTMETVINHLGSNILTINNLHQIYTTLHNKSGIILNRLIIQRDVPIPLTLKINIDSNYIIICLNIFGPLQKFENIRIDFGYKASEWIYFVEEHKESIIGTSVLTNMALLKEGGGYIVQFKYALDLIKPFFDIKNYSLPLVIGIGKFSSAYCIENSTLIPLTLEFKDINIKLR